MCCLKPQVETEADLGVSGRGVSVWQLRAWKLHKSLNDMDLVSQMYSSLCQPNLQFFSLLKQWKTLQFFYKYIE